MTERDLGQPEVELVTTDDVRRRYNRILEAHGLPPMYAFEGDDQERADDPA